MKYSEAFERDWNWYYKWKDVFTFSGKPLKFIAIEDKNGVSAKEAFYKIDSNGKNIPTKEPELLNQILLCKASVNFNIKMWAEDRGKGCLGKLEFQNIIKEYELLPWMVEAVENQKLKYY